VSSKRREQAGRSSAGVAVSAPDAVELIDDDQTLEELNDPEGKHLSSTKPSHWWPTVVMFGLMWGFVTLAGIEERFWRMGEAVAVWALITAAMSAEVVRQRRHYRRALRWQAHQRRLSQGSGDG